MSQHFKQAPHNAITDSHIARVLSCKELSLADPLKWLKLGCKDVGRAPWQTLFYGLIFAAIPWFITYLVRLTGWHLVILPAMVCFMLIGPFLAAGLYDISWQLGKERKPSLWHSIKAIKRNAVNELGFGILLMVLMIFWLRIASVIHALYPPYLDENLQNLIPFLALGTVVGAGFTLLVFFLSVFTQPILMERKVNLATAVLTSMNTVWSNKIPMLFWALIILISVLIGFASGFIGFVILMPIIGYATWHGYLDSITIKRPRVYE